MTRALTLIAALSMLALWAPASARAQDGPTRAVSPGLSPERLRAALQRYRNEPTVQELIDAALEQRLTNPGRVHDAISRARGTGWLPTTRASVRRRQGVDLLSLTGPAQDPAHLTTLNALTFRAQMTFHFDRILFANQETTLLRELRALERRQIQIAEAVASLYYERRRLQLERDLLGRTDVARSVRILETEALLDSFTGGAFTRMMGSR